ncbi:MAG: protein kinase [Verrucomicrobiaceae bacterium]|nr:protein kinase [Verrucomicrobiaceae bacterium]
MPLATDGLCPKCLMGEAMQPTQAESRAEHLPPMTPEELAPSFPQLEILECLGRGGMGVVYKARQKSLNRLVALKLLAPERADDPQFATRFEKEAQALAALNHPHIVAVHDFGSVVKSSGLPSDASRGPTHTLYFLLMEYVDGVNLRQLLTTKRLTPKEALSIVPPVCDALQCAHDHGIVHRDIKPENLLIDKSGVVKIADFGVAKIVGEVDRPEQTSVAQGTMGLGTPAYAAPEQQGGYSDHRADIYSLGVVLYEMLTGERPREKIEAPSKRVQVDVRIDEIVLRALEKTPELRFSTAAEFRSQVEAVTHPSDKPLSATQSSFQRWMPEHWFEAMKAESQKWHLVCECGHATSVWDRGGIRFGASGKPIKLMSCPACHGVKPHRTEWHGEGGPDNPEKGSLRAGAISAAVWVGLALAALGIVFLVEVIRDGMRSEGMILLAAMLAGTAPVITGILRGKWMRGFAVSAFILALPCLLIGGFFVYAMTQESGGWNPTPSEAFLVPVSFIGAVFFPIAGLALWHGGRPPGRKMGCGGLLLTICILGLVLLLVMLGVWISSRDVSQALKDRQTAVQVEIPGPADVADGFDFPVGAPDGEGYHLTREAFGKDNPHAGEDWDGDGEANSDLGASVHAIAHGLVVFSENTSVGHGNVIIIRHNYWDPKGRLQVCESSYHHLQQRLVRTGERIKRGQKIGTLGNNNGLYPAHLHFELRKTPGMGLEQTKYEKSTKNYWAPSDFIREHRPVKKDTSASNQ